jgi:hypothetical protein
MTPSESLVCNRQEEIGTAALLFSTRGYVTLRNVVPPNVIRSASSMFMAILEDCIETRSAPGVRAVSRMHGAHFFHYKGRYRIFPRLEGALAHEMLIGNPLARAVLASLLGDRFYCKFVGSDTCLGDAELQSPHRDVGFYRGAGPHCCVMNIPLVDCRLDNGPLEVWPNGTHFWSAQRFRQLGLLPFVPDGRHPQLEQLLDQYPAEKIQMNLGDILLRDPGMMHRGTPNQSGQHRPMLTIGLARRGYHYEYGSLDANLDPAAFQALSAGMKRMFDYAFDQSTPFYWWMRLQTRLNVMLMHAWRIRSRVRSSLQAH